MIIICGGAQQQWLIVEFPSDGQPVAYFTAPFPDYDYSQTWLRRLSGGKIKALVSSENNLGQSAPPLARLLFEIPMASLKQSLLL